MRTRTRGHQLLLGVVTLLPLLFFVLLFAGSWFALSNVEHADRGLIKENDGSSPLMPTLLIAGLVLVVLTLGLQAFYVAHAYRRMPPGRRWFWIAFVLLGQLFAMPVYWYFNIWQERREAT